MEKKEAKKPNKLDVFIYNVGLEEYFDEKESSDTERVLKEGLTSVEFIDERVAVSGNPLTE